MRQITSTIQIAEPVTKVWDILMDFDNWQEWNPIVTQVSGNASIGSKLSITMRGKDGKAANRYMPVITKFDKPKSFRWRAKMLSGFLFTNDKIFELEEVASVTRLVHIEAFSGILVSLFWSKLNMGVPAMLNSMNAALKNLAEKITE